MLKQKFLFLLILSFVIKLQAQSNLKFDKEAITKILYQHTNDDSPGVALGIVEDGQIVYEHYLGYSNLEHQVKVDKNTRFNIASNAKQFTALCILQLMEEGKIKPQDDFRKYLPNLYKDLSDKITIADLVSHTSGIRDYCDLLALQGKTWWKQFIDNDDAIELLQGQRDLNFKPGTEYLYSNSNYILLTEIIREVTDQDFSDFAKTMFDAMDMPNTRFLSNYMAVIPHKARPYGNWNGWREEPAITEVHGDGALFTTLQDQLQWEQMLQANDGKYFSQKLINESQSPILGSIEEGYGYGLEFAKNKELSYTFHNGATSAYSATFLRFPKHKLSIVIMTNSRSVPSNYAAWQVADLVLELEDDQTVYPSNPDKVEQPKDIREVLGNYQSDDGTVISITEKDGSLYQERYQWKAAKLIQEKGGLFEYETTKGAKINFSNIGQTKQQFTLYKSSQKPITYYKVSNLDFNNFDKDELNGRFYNEETNTEIIIKYVEDNTYSLTKNGRERKAQLILADYLRMMNSYHIKVIRDKEHKIIGLNVKNNRIKNVIFNKN